MKKSLKINKLGLIVFSTLFFLSMVFNFYFLSKEFFPLGFRKDIKGKVIVSRVIDGDTFDGKDERRYRLAGADAPEYPKDCLSRQAKDRLEELILGKEVEVKVIKKDNFGRELAYIFLNGLLINQVMVEEGLAQALAGSPEYDPLILSGEEKAKKLEKGIWSSFCQPKKDCFIKGNVRGDTKTRIYHLPECFNYPKIIIKEEEGDRWFCSQEEAENAGFVKSRDCP